MKRLFIAAVAGLCAVGSAGAQDGGFAPTTPVVPPPVLHNGSLVTPGGGRLFAANNWSPLRSPVVAGGPASGYTVPPLAGGTCGPTGCATGRGGFSLDRLKAYFCYQPTPTGLPKLQPAPYVTPLQGLFGCSSAGGCTTGCAVGAYAPANYAYPQQPGAYPQPMPMNPPVAPGAGAVLMPSRGVAGAALQPTWQGRVTPMQADASGVAGYRLPALEPVVNTGYTRPR